MSSTDATVDFQTSSELSKYHQRLRNETRERLKDLFAKTPTLRDLHCDVTPEEIAAEIAIVNGDSIKVYIAREPYQQLKVIVPRNGTVRDLKAAFRRSYTTYQKRQQSAQNDNPRTSFNEAIPNISWKYIWRTYYLQNDTDPLIDDERPLRAYGVGNKSVLKFVKKIKIDRRMQRNKLKDKQKWNSNLNKN